MKSAPEMEVWLFDPGQEARRARNTGEEEKGDAVCARTFVSPIDALFRCTSQFVDIRFKNPLTWRPLAPSCFSSTLSSLRVPPF